MRIKDSGDSRVRGLEYSKTQGLGVLSTRRLGDLSSRGPKDSKFMSYSGIHGDLEIQRLWAPYVLGKCEFTHYLDRPIKTLLHMFQHIQGGFYFFTTFLCFKQFRLFG